jgi:hypothetical protein
MRLVGADETGSAAVSSAPDLSQAFDLREEEPEQLSFSISSTTPVVAESMGTESAADRHVEEAEKAEEQPAPAAVALSPSVEEVRMPVAGPQSLASEPPAPSEAPPAEASTFPNPSSGAPVHLEYSSSSSGQLAAPEPPSASTHAPAQPPVDLSHWSTGEVAIQPHRPSSKKKKKASRPEPELPAESLTRNEAPAAEEPEPPAQVFQEPAALLSDPPQQEEWIRTGESIRFIESAPPVSVEQAPQVSSQAELRATGSVSTAAAAVDVLFESSGRFTKTAAPERPSKPKRRRVGAAVSRIRIAVTIFVGSCFSTTRAVAMSLLALTVLLCAMAALAVGGIGLAWLIMEQPPSPAFHSLTPPPPQRTLSDPRKNGYLLLLGFDAPPGSDPLQAGYERKPDGAEAARAAACLGGPGDGGEVGPANASESVASGWFRGSDPAGRFLSHQDTIKGWASQAEPALARYKQWLKLPFEDWGYGQAVSPPCGAILFTHRLYLADGFVQGSEAGFDRLEADMEVWRIVLGQAKTLPVKTMALQAIHDNIAVASGLLVKPDFDGTHLGRLAKMLRPLDQVELSIRWPMQSQLVSAAKTFAAQLKAEQGEDPPLYAAVAAALPLPKQRRFNDYAAYYEASYKAAGEGRYGSMPKWSYYLRYPAASLLDYLGNPIENIIGLEPLPAWDRYTGLVVDTDAHLRLASLQAWLRRGPQDADLLARIAKAGQNFYDPYTGLPMLVNLKKGVMYSVGHDGKDQEADPQNDVVVAIPISSFRGR